MDPLEAFAAHLERTDQDIELARAALLVARLEYPDLDVDQYLGVLDTLARQASRVIAGLDAPAIVAAALAGFLHHAHRFAGNTVNYYDPRNSYLNDVLDRRVGIPITLSAVYLEVGWRLGLPLEGVGMPGHFLVRHRHATQPALLDPFTGGTLLTEVDCAARLQQIYGPTAQLTPAMLAPVSTRSILYRMLTNLKHVYVSREDWSRAIRTIDALLVVDPGATQEYRDRGMLRMRHGDLRRARADLDHYLTSAALVEDAANVRQQIGLIDRLETMRN